MEHHMVDNEVIPHYEPQYLPDPQELKSQLTELCWDAYHKSYQQHRDQGRATAAFQSKWQELIQSYPFNQIV